MYRYFILYMLHIPRSLVFFFVELFQETAESTVKLKWKTLSLDVILTLASLSERF